MSCQSSLLRSSGYKSTEYVSPSYLRAIDTVLQPAMPVSYFILLSANETARYFVDRRERYTVIYRMMQHHRNSIDIPDKVPKTEYTRSQITRCAEVSMKAGQSAITQCIERCRRTTQETSACSQCTTQTLTANE